MEILSLAAGRRPARVCDPRLNGRNRMALAELKRDLGFAMTLLRRRPFQCFLQVTNRCNMRCGFCDFWPNGAHPSEELTVAEYRRLADDLAGLGTFLISLEGGEPFVRP